MNRRMLLLLLSVVAAIVLAVFDKRTVPPAFWPKPIWTVVTGGHDGAQGNIAQSGEVEDVGGRGIKLDR